MKVTVVDGTTGEPIHDAHIGVYGMANQYCASPIIKPTAIGHSSKHGLYTFYNLVSKTYSFFARKDGYKVNCRNVNIFNTQTIVVELVPNVPVNKFHVVLEWDSQIDLDLYATFNFNEQLSCTVGYINPTCGTMTYWPNNDKENSNYEVITVDKYGQYHYLIYINQYISTKLAKKLNTEIAANTSNGYNYDFVHSNAVIK